MKWLRSHKHAVQIAYVPAFMVMGAAVELVGLPFIIAALVVGIVVCLVMAIVS